MCKPGLVTVNTEVGVMSWTIDNGMMSKAMVTLHLTVVKMKDNSMDHVLKAKVLTRLNLSHLITHQKLLAAAVSKENCHGGQFP